MHGTTIKIVPFTPLPWVHFRYLNIC